MSTTNEFQMLQFTPSRRGRQLLLALAVALSLPVFAAVVVPPHPSAVLSAQDDDRTPTTTW